MTTTDGAIIRVGPPQLRGGRVHCPRCANRLLFDGDHFLCLACGYEYTPEGREAEVLLGGRRRRERGGVRALSVAAGVLAGMVAGKIALAVALTAAVGLFIRDRARDGRDQS